MAYIDTKHLGKCETCRHCRSGECNTYCDCGEEYSPDMSKIPTADAVEVKHGKWLPDYETFVDEWERESEPIQTGWVCSLCGRQEFNREPYCHCGAKMDGKDGADND